MTSILNQVLISVEEELADYMTGVKTDIFKRIYLNPVQTRGDFDNYDLSRALEYVDGCADALLEGHRKVVSFCENTIKDMDIYEVRSFFSEIRDMWFDSFVYTYAHPQNGSGQWCESDVERANRYADASIHAAAHIHHQTVLQVLKYKQERNSGFDL